MNETILEKTIYSTKFWTLIAAIIAAVAGGFTGTMTWPNVLVAVIGALGTFMVSRASIDVAKAATAHHHKKHKKLEDSSEK